MGNSLNINIKKLNKNQAIEVINYLSSKFYLNLNDLSNNNIENITSKKLRSLKIKRGCLK